MQLSYLIYLLFETSYVIGVATFNTISPLENLVVECEGGLQIASCLIRSVNYFSYQWPILKAQSLLIFIVSEE